MTKGSVHGKRKGGDVARERVRALSGRSIASFRAAVWSHWKKHGRHDLPWRKTHDPYKILVSEIMLQQTQVARVIGKYKSFLKRFPTARALTKAPLSAVLKEWSGLGYNKRAKYLHDAVKKIVGEYHGDFHEALQPPPARLNGRSSGLPGVGPYTRAAVRVFAFNEPDVLLETNVRTVFLHHFYRNRTSVKDAEVVPYMELAARGQDPRKWHWALMDHGAHLKESGVRNIHRSAHYRKQSKFEGSLRQVRGAILRELRTSSPAIDALAFDKEKTERALSSLSRDGLATKEKGLWRLA